MKKTIPLGSRKAGALVLILALGLAAICPAAEDTWTQKADMPTARGFLSTIVVNEKIYAIGGALNPTTGSSAVEEYNPATNTWTKKANMSETRCAFSTSVVDGKVYVIGGAVSPYGALRSSIYVYDPATDTWTQKAQMLTPRAGLSANVVDGKIYVIGGAFTSISAALKTVEVYDPATNNWTRKTDMPTARLDHCASVVNGKIYIIGGTIGSPWTGLSVVEVYDPATDTWTRKADMPTARWGLGGCEVNGKIYAIGGASAPAWFSTVEQYNPSTNIWTTKTPMATARREFSTSVVDGKIYAIGGVSGPQGATYALATVEEYDTGLGVPSPDFNGDGKVDIEDLIILIEHWGTDEPMCDIAPRPFGDGIVDVLDLELLMSYWGQEIDDPTLIAHWALDETQGIIAYDSAGENDVTLYGEPTWQPEGGKFGGALAFDGVDDYIFAPNGLNPADGPFSIFAWIQGGAPGQVVISQLNGADWLSADPASGFLMTALCESGRGGSSLKSDSIITDGDWHRIGFVWDGVHRALYVDDILAAESTQQGLGSATGGLNIGCGMNSGAATFWSGLIDDIRIYNRALHP